MTKKFRILDAFHGFKYAVNVTGLLLDFMGVRIVDKPQ